MSGVGRTGADGERGSGGRRRRAHLTLGLAVLLAVLLVLVVWLVLYDAAR